MPVDGIYEDLTLVRRRARAVFLAVAAVLALVLVYYWKVQILEHRRFAGMAEANQTRMRSKRPPAASSSTVTGSSWPTTGPLSRSLSCASGSRTRPPPSPA